MSCRTQNNLLGHSERNDSEIVVVVVRRLWQTVVVGDQTDAASGHC
jgi:hypothetical protein